MSIEKLRAWWWTKQGLDGSLGKASAAEVLAKTGWARSFSLDSPKSRVPRIEALRKAGKRAR